MSRQVKFVDRLARRIAIPIAGEVARLCPDISHASIDHATEERLVAAAAKATADEVETRLEASQIRTDFRALVTNLVAWAIPLLVVAGVGTVAAAGSLDKDALLIAVLAMITTAISYGIGIWIGRRFPKVR